MVAADVEVGAGGGVVAVSIWVGAALVSMDGQ